MNSPASRIADIGVYLPPTTRSTEESELRLRTTNPHVNIASGLIRRLTGVNQVHVRPEGWQTSDLAVAAAREVLTPGSPDPDLLIFASASQDLIEPATSHIVAHKLGLNCPVMDVKNACNSMLNGMQVADSLIRAQQYKRVLVVTGEQPSHAVRWQIEDQAQFVRSIPGYTMSDSGAAILMEAISTEHPAGVGILETHFQAHSQFWPVGTLGTGGSMNPHAEGGSYFDMNGNELQKAFDSVGLDLVHDALKAVDLSLDDVDLFAAHQVSVASQRAVLKRLGIPANRSIETVSGHGNLASATLPLHLHRARESGQIGSGSNVVLLGLAGGISLGVMVIRL
ncbi:ketoacyl-ACP synthase III [Leucobacter viscericola]|uniref:Ketoacyl-ACP synthase III n=1 Tax=Leucobacter viscericola TaxID=2714935 RepID=A0A6G7XBE9_9MICO|nr:ketoacyl-ACP synthase III [Leucobacter viscericola]QIK61885.1 ketoacyl-ACP synthase III [Leucobacter viscericola]